MMDVEGGYDAGVAAAGGEQNVVTIIAKFGTATVKAPIPVAKIDEILNVMRKVEAAQDKRTTDPRQAAMSFVIRAMKNGDHLRQPTGTAVVGTLFWLASTRPGWGDYALERARQGGAVICWTITEGGSGYGNNWRLTLDGTPDDAALVPTPKHPLPGRPGGPPLNS